MDDSARDRARKTFQRVFPPELAKKLQFLELSEEQLKNKDQLYENLINYWLNMNNLVSEYTAKHPNAILNHLSQTSIEQHLKYIDDLIEDQIQFCQQCLDSNPFMGLFVIYFLCRSENIDKIYPKSDLHRFMSYPGDHETFVSNAALIAEYACQIGEASTFIEKEKYIVTYTDKIIERYLIDIYWDICLIEGELNYESETLGTLKRRLEKHEDVRIMLPFILDSEIIDIRNAFAHPKENVKPDYNKEVFRIRNFSKPYRCQDIESILIKLGAIHSGYLIGKIFYMLVVQNKVNLTIKLPKIEESDGDTSPSPSPSPAAGGGKN